MSRRNLHPKKPKPHEDGVLTECDDGFPRSWHYAANPREAVDRYVEVLERLRAYPLGEPSVVKLVQRGQVVEQTRLSGERD